MHVLIAAEYHHADLKGGAPRVVADCAHELVARGHEVSVVCARVEGRPEVEMVSGVRLLRYTEARALSPLRRRYIAISKLLKKEFLRPPDLIWGHAPLQFLAACRTFPESARAYVVHSPYPLEVLALHDTLTISDRLKASAAKYFEGQCLTKAKRVQVLSEFTKREILSLHGRGFEAKTFVTPGWCDTTAVQPVRDRREVRQRLGWPLDVPVFFTLRRLVPRMGIADLIIACAGLAEAGFDFHLYVGGEGHLRSALQQQIVDSKLQSTVIMLGQLTEEQLRDAYAACDAFLIPTRALECFGLIAVEALAAGVPVLSTDTGALPEVVGEFEPAWVSESGSVSLQKTLREFLEGRLPRHSVAEQRAYVERKYSRQVALRRFCDVALATLDGSRNSEAEFIVR